MNTRILITAAIVAASSVAVADDPPLATTFDWLAKHVAANSRVASRQNTAQGSYASSAEASLTADPRTCQMTVGYRYTFVSGGKTSVSTGTLSFDVKSLEPRTLAVVPGYTSLDFSSPTVCRGGNSDFVEGTASIVASTYQRAASVGHRTSSGAANIDRICIPLANRESADRVLAAMQAACRACGCKAEPF